MRLLVLCGMLMALTVSPVVAAPLTDAFLETEVRHWVREAMGPHEDMTVHVGRRAPLGRLQGIDATLRMRFLQTPRPRGPVLVSVEMWAAGKRLAQRTITVRVQIWKPVLVASRGMRRHERIDVDALQTERLDIRAQPGRVFVDSHDILGLRVKKTLRPGEVILARSLEIEPVVQRGDAVSIEIQVGQVMVKAVGTAQGNGGPGEQIAVKNDRSGKRLQCVVVEAGVVRVIDPKTRRAGR